MDNDILEIWNNMNKQLFGFVNKKVKNADLAKDIIQDVFLKIFTKIDTLKEKDKIVSWIYQITRNEINTYFRKTKQTTEDNSLVELEEIEENFTVEFSKCVNPMIDALPDKYKQAIVLSEIEGVSQKDLAKTLEISYSGAKSRVQRGREMLKNLLQQCCSVSSDKYGNITEYNSENCANSCTNSED